MLEKYLYFEPVIYVPYELSLKKKDNLKLLKMWIEDGAEINLDQYFDKFIRLPNQHYIRADFKTPLNMNIGEIIDTDRVVTLHMQYEINFEGQLPIVVFHRQHLKFNGNSKEHNLINQYSSSFALPAMFASEGSKLAKENTDESKSVMQMGLMIENETNQTWMIETVSALYPNTELKHGTMN